MNSPPVYYAGITTLGPIHYHDQRVPDCIGVLGSPDDPTPIGIAFKRTWNAAGMAVWSLQVHKVGVPGRWVIIDQRFVPTGPEDRPEVVDLPRDRGRG